MSDEIANSFEEQDKSETQPNASGRSVSLTITMHPNGQIEFSMPSNKVLAHGLLGAAQEQLAKLAVMSDVAQAKEQIRGGNGLAGLMKRMGKG